MKKCSTCQENKPRSEFCKDKYRKDGLCNTCRDCRSSYETRVSKRRKAQKAVYYVANKLRIDGKNAEWQKANPEKMRALSRAHYHRNPQRELERNKRWRAANPEIVKAQHAKRIATRDKAEAAATVKRWRERHPEDSRAMVAAHRAKRKQAPGRFTGAQVEALYIKQRGKCAVCRDALPKRFHRDHITPIKLGGSNYIENIQLLCQPCNSSKSARDPIEFMQSKGMLL